MCQERNRPLPHCVLVGHVGIAQSKNNLQLNQMKPVPSGLLSVIKLISNQEVKIWIVFHFLKDYLKALTIECILQGYTADSSFKVFIPLSANRKRCEMLSLLLSSQDLPEKGIPVTTCLCECFVYDKWFPTEAYQPHRYLII